MREGFYAGLHHAGRAERCQGQLDHRGGGLRDPGGCGGEEHRGRLGHDEANEVVAVIQRLARDGMTIAIIEHTMQAMVRLVDSFLVLDHGAVIVEGEPEAVTRDSRVIEAYLGKKWMAHAPH